MARNRRPRDQPVVALLSLMLVALSLLIQPGYSLSIAKFPDSPSSATPNGADIAKNCEMILTSMRMRVSLSNMSPNNKLYRVRLKVFTTHADTLDILKMPSLQGVVPRTIYNKEKNRGFTANITDEQICELYQLPTVNNITPCGLSMVLCNPNEKNPTPLPSSKPAIKNAPDLTGLTPDCAKIIWYTLVGPGTLWQVAKVAGQYAATLKPYITREQAEQIIYSPEANGTIFRETDETMWRNDAEGKMYIGRWNYTQLCYLEHRPEISFVGAGQLYFGMEDSLELLGVVGAGMSLQWP